MSERPRPEIRALAQSIKDAGHLDALKKAIVTPPDPATPVKVAASVSGEAASQGPIPKAPEVKGMPSRYEITDGDRASVDRVLTNIAQDFGIAKPVIASENYSAIRSLIINLVSALQRFKTSGKTIRPDLSLSFPENTRYSGYMPMAIDSSSDAILRVLKSIESKASEGTVVTPEDLDLGELAQAIEAEALRLEKVYPYLDLDYFKGLMGEGHSQAYLFAGKNYLEAISDFAVRYKDHVISDEISFVLPLGEEKRETGGYAMELMTGDQRLVIRMSMNIPLEKFKRFLECVLITDVEIEDPEIRGDNIRESLSKMRDKFKTGPIAFFNPVFSLDHIIKNRPVIINNISDAFEIFAQEHQFDPRLEIMFELFLNEQREDAVCIDFTLTPQEIAKALAQAHEELSPAVPESFDRQEFIREFLGKYPFIKEEIRAADTTNEALKTTLDALEESLTDPEIQELIATHYIHRIFIGNHRGCSFSSANLVLEAGFNDVDTIRRVIKENKGNFIFDDSRAPELDLINENEPEEPKFDVAAAIESIKSKYNVASIEIKPGIPEDELEAMFIELDYALSQIIELEEITPLSITIDESREKRMIYYNGKVIINRQDFTTLTGTINQYIEGFKDNKKAKEIGDEIASYGIVLTNCDGETASLSLMENLRSALQSLANPREFNGVYVMMDNNPGENIVNPQYKEIKIGQDESVDGIVQLLKMYQERVAAMELAQDERDTAAALEALLGGNLADKLGELQEAVSPETEPVPGRMYQDGNGNLFIVYDTPGDSGDFMLFNVSTGHREFSNTQSFVQKVSNKNLELVQAAKVDLGRLDANRATRKAYIEDDIPRSVRRPEHQDYWILDSQQEFESQQQAIKQKIANQEAITPEDIQDLYRAQQRVGIMRQIRQEYRFDPAASHIVYYRDHASGVYSRQEAIARMSREPGFGNHYTMTERRETLARVKREELEIGARLARMRQGTPEYLFESERLSYNQLLQERLTQVIDNLPTPPIAPPLPPSPSFPDSSIPLGPGASEPILNIDWAAERSRGRRPRPEERVFPAGRGFAELRQSLTPKAIRELKGKIKRNLLGGFFGGEKGRVKDYVQGKVSEFESLGETINNSEEAIVQAKQHFLENSHAHQGELGDRYTRALEREYTLVAEVDTILSNVLSYLETKAKAQKLLEQTVPRIIAEAQSLVEEYQNIDTTSFWAESDPDTIPPSPDDEGLDLDLGEPIEDDLRIERVNIIRQLNAIHSESLEPEVLSPEAARLFEEVDRVIRVKSKRELKNPKQWSIFKRSREMLLLKWQSQSKGIFKKEITPGLANNVTKAHSVLRELQNKVNLFIEDNADYFSIYREMNDSEIEDKNNRARDLIERFNRAKDTLLEATAQVGSVAGRINNLISMIK